MANLLARWWQRLANKPAENAATIPPRTAQVVPVESHARVIDTDGSVRHLFDMEDTQPIGDPRPKWVRALMGKLGQHEVAGPLSNPWVLACLEMVGITGPKVDDSTTAWCAASVQWALAEAGIRGTGKANARSYLTWGEPLAGPVMGCIVVFSRPPNPAHGHVGFVVGVGPGKVYQVLSGNEHNAVSVLPYPMDRRLGFRWPTGIALPSRSM